MLTIAIIVSILALPISAQKSWDFYRAIFIAPKLYANAVPISLETTESAANGSTDRINF